MAVPPGRPDLGHDAAGARGEISDTELRINLSALLIGGNLTTPDLIGDDLPALTV